MQTILEAQALGKSYLTENKELKVLQEVTFQVTKGEVLSIVGPSGSGKTTLLGLCAGLDTATTGTVHLHGHDLQTLSEDEKAGLRNDVVGFVFQTFQLIPTLTALENVMVPLELKKDREAAATAKALLDKVGLTDRLHHYPRQLSGGEQQRVAIARAFANDPAILFADEPTGNLDDETSEQVEQLLFDLNKAAGTTLVVVTHDLELARKTQRIIRLKGGRIASDEKIASKPQPAL